MRYRRKPTGRNYEGFPTLSPNLVNFDPQMAKITSRFHHPFVIFAWHAGRPSDRNCSAFSLRRSPLFQQRCYDNETGSELNVEPDTRRPALRGPQRTALRGRGTRAEEAWAPGPVMTR